MAKELGNEQFKQKNYEKAIEFYTQAISENPADHTIYGNRSASYHNLKNYQQALVDGQKCVELKPDWSKGHQRKAMALHGLKQYEDSIDAYMKAMELDPSNDQLKQQFQVLQSDYQKSMRGGGGLFGGPDADAKLKSNPRIAKYFEDPKFKMMWEMGQQNPQMMMQLMQTDPRMMDCFKELTGIDLMDVQEQSMKSQEKEKEEKKKREAEEKIRKEEEERKRKEAEEAALPEEEKKKIQIRKESEALKTQGNEFYKKKQFDQALSFYQQAADKNPEDGLTYYSNKAACYFEMKKYENCIEECDKAIESSKGTAYDYVKLAKAMARKANSLLQLEKFDDSIYLYEKALLENQDPAIKTALNQAKKIKKEKEALAYIDPVKAEEHRQKGNELFKEGAFPAALKEYEEGIKRDPKAVAIYSNRCATYIKLMEFATALKDADKCLELDSKFVKAYARKGTCHHFLKEYHKALKAFDDGLKLDPQNKECIEGRNKTMMTIQMTAGAESGNDEERLRHAMADPEIQQIMRDPSIIQVLKELQENPKAAMGAFKDPLIADKINKLIAAGVLKMG